MTSQMDSDHCPIIMTTATIKNCQAHDSRFNISKANWNLYENHPILDTFNEHTQDTREQVDELYTKIQIAANTTIPKSQTKTFFPKP